MKERILRFGAKARAPLDLIAAFMRQEAAGGLALMAAAVLALIIANSPFAPLYFHALRIDAFGLSLHRWINDGLMALFFLLVGLEIKHELLVGALADWRARALPGIAALGGMIAPALVYAAFNHGDPVALRGWAIPTATDIAFVLGVLALLRSRVPNSLKVFLTALAIIDDLGAVVIIALFYSAHLSLVMLGGAMLCLAVLFAMNRFGIVRLWLYLIVGAVLWLLVLKSGVHAAIAGLALAFAIPLRMQGGRKSPLERLEQRLHPVSAFFVVPLFGFANAGVSFAALSWGALVHPVLLGIVGGLFAGKQLGVFCAIALVTGLGLAPKPEGASWIQLYGASLLTGIGFTMSLFIGLLAFSGSAHLQDFLKLGVLAGSLCSGLAGTAVLLAARPQGR